MLCVVEQARVTGEVFCGFLFSYASAVLAMRWDLWRSKRPGGQEADALHRFSTAGTGHDPGRAFGQWGGFLPVEQGQNAGPFHFGGRTPPAKISDAMKATGQDVLEKAAQKLRGVQRDRFPATGVAGLIFESRAPVLFLHDSLRT